MLRVRDVMSADVVTAPRDARFKDLVRLMADRKVGGLPVLDAAGGLAGIVTGSDLLRVESPDRPTGRKKRLGEDVRARDLMTQDVVTADPDLPLPEAARLMIRSRVKRLPVLERGRVTGIVAREDLLRPFLREDRDIARDVVSQISHDLWLDPDRLHLSVRDGVVSMTGAVDRRSDRDLLVERTHAIAGVVGVQANVLYRVDDRRLRPPSIDPSRMRTTSLPGDFTPGGLRGR
ncbi:MAG TPA: CBS domain-containing protein [Actinomycetota bacterium]|jgi:CBS-domain-containing membrane protein